MSDSDGHTRSFEAFNARFLTSEEVAKTFIPPKQYDDLADTKHSVLFGPRGSGKTTLLKMLQLRTLAAWEHPRASEIRKKLGFHAVFLGTDVLWGSQLESRTSAIQDRDKRNQIRRASFRLHLSIAFLNALEECGEDSVKNNQDLARFYFSFDRAKEAELSRSLSKVWKLDEDISSFLGARVAIRSQISDLFEYIEDLRENSTVPLPQFVKIDPVTSITGAIDVANSVMSQPQRRWGILCDELEIAPDMIRRDLFELLRSTSHNIIFKFSLFPYSTELERLSNPLGATENNDYIPLDLTYGRRESAYDFCRALFDGMILASGGKPVADPMELLGDGWFDGGRKHRRNKGSAYAAPHGEFYLRALRLRKNDPTFLSWLKASNIHLREISELTDAKQAPFRKALPFILTRSEFIRQNGQFRSRKAHTLYTGTYSLFSITEGNPRVFINLMRPIVKRYIEKPGTISDAFQAKSAEVTIHRFRSSLASIPTSGYQSIRSVLQLIEVIGSYFQREQLLESFKAEPASTFVVDKNVPEELIELVGRGLNAGAFVRMPDNESEVVSDLNHRRLRLAYTLAPEYKLPLVSGRSINLSTIFNHHENRYRGKAPEEYQIRLPLGVS